MAKDINSHSFSKVLYIEPNYNTEAQQQIGTYYYNHDLEDYCIYVDLMVECYGRNIEGSVKQGNTYFIFSWKTDSKGDTISFMGGKRVTLDNGEKLNILTTDYTKVHYSDITEDLQNAEMFGIDSIDISYNNYTVPQVFIHFTDIKGASLFAPSEMKHHKSDGSIGGVDDVDIAGSFFQSFFSFPYPRFQLLVKGFYGEPVSYELMCYNFKAKFDSKTGNFGADAQFTGYLYSLLPDITLNGLLAAPYADYGGKEYWVSQGGNGANEPEKQLADANSRFSIKNGDDELVKMPTLGLVIKSMNNVRTDGRLSEAESQTTAIADTNLTAIHNCRSHYNILFDTAKTTLNNYTDRYFCDVERKAFLLLLTESESQNSVDEIINIDINDFNTKCQTEIELLTESVKLPAISKPTMLGQILGVKDTDNKMYVLQGKTLDRLTNINDNLSKALDENKISNDFTYGLLFDASNFLNTLQQYEQKFEIEKNDADAKLQEIRTQIISDALGFDPSVYNFMKIIFAHVETFFHLIYAATDEVNQINKSSNPRTIKDINVPNGNATGLNLGSNGIVEAWPKVVGPDPKTKSLVDVWIGNFLRNGEMQPEAKLINGLLKGMNFIQDAQSQYEETLAAEREAAQEKAMYSTSHFFNSSVIIPTNVYDSVLEGSVYDEKFNTPEYYQSSDDGLKTIIYQMAYRMIPTLCMDNKGDFDDFDILGKMDAINFFNSCGKNIDSTTKSIFTAATEEEITDLLNQNEWSKYGVNDSLLSQDFSKYAVCDKISNKLDNCFINEYKSEYSNYSSAVVFSDNLKKYDEIDNLGTLKYIENSELNEYTEVLKDLYRFRQPYNTSLIYDTHGCFTNDYDGTNSGFFKYIDIDDSYTSVDTTYINDKITLGYKWSMSEENENGNAIETNKPSKNSGVIAKTPTDDDKAFPVYDSNDEDSTLKCNDKIYNRKEFDFDEFIGNVSNPFQYTIPTIQYYDKAYSLFASEEFYEAETKEEKAFLFLDNLRYHDPRHLSEMFIDDDYSYLFCTEVSALLCGAYLYLNENERKRSGDDLYCMSKTFWNGDLNDYVRKEFINRFKKWVDDTTNSGFTYFYKEFVLHTSKGKEYQTEELAAFRDAIDSDKTTSKQFHSLVDDTFRRNYMKVTDNYRLYIREDSDVAKRLMEFNLKPLMIIKPFRNSVQFDDFDTEYLTDNYKSYVHGFKEKLNQLFGNDSTTTPEESSSTRRSVENVPTTDEVKIGLYKYCKILYDKWFGGFKESDWRIENFFNGHFHFIDTFYNDISDSMKLNPEIIANFLIMCFGKEGQNLLSFITAILEKNNATFQSTQNFLSLNDQNFIEATRNMFKPISYVNMKKPDSRPHFIVLYSGDKSHHLNMSSSEYVDDSFMLNYENESNWPTAITNKVDGVDLPIPAFGITYGSQYQSYFTDIDVGTEDGMNTEQSLLAQAKIAKANSTSADENGTQTYVIGQDLFTVYANRSYTCTVTMLGCAWIQPLMYFVLCNIPLFRGSYLIQKVTHKISPGKMTTTFVGTRMANTMTPFVKNVYQGTSQGGVYNGNGSNEIDNSINASIDNNCGYKVYPVGQYGSSTDMNKLTESGGYAKYITTDDVKNRYDTIAEALTCVAIAENGGASEVGIKLTITALYNRYVSGKRIFAPHATAYDTYSHTNHPDSKHGNYDKVYKYVLDIFGGSPMNSGIIGQTTKTIFTDKYIYENGVKTSNHVAEHTIITQLMLQQVDSWVTPEYYNDLSKHGADFHRGAKYLATDGGIISPKTKEKIYGTVFVTTKKNNETYWTPQNNDKNDDGIGKNGISDIGNSLINAVQQTINSTNKVSGTIRGVKSKSNNPNNFIITSDDKTILGNVCDILFNAYSKYLTQIWWLSEHEGDMYSQEYPTKYLIVEVTDGDSDSTKFKVLNSKNQPIFLSSNINPKIFKILAKHYLPLNDCNNIRRDCNINTSTTDDDIKKWLNDNAPENCTTSFNGNNGYSDNYIPSDLTFVNNGNAYGSMSNKEADNRIFQIFGKQKNEITKAEASAQMVTFPVECMDMNGNIVNRNITMHRLVAEEVKAIFHEIAELKRYPILSIGGFAYRKINNANWEKKHPGKPKPLSNHSFGLGIDINACTNPNNKNDYLNPFPGTLGKDTHPTDDELHIRTPNHDIVKIFVKHGFGWGGSFKDYMHFSYLGGH